MTRVHPVLIALAVALACSALWWNTGLGETDDDARMILEARALWDHGAWPYHTNHLGMVVLLAPVSRSMVGIHVLGVVAFLAAVAGTYYLGWFACGLSRGWALLAACLYATGPLALYWSAQPMTEIPFTAAFVWSLVAAVSAGQREGAGLAGTWRWLVAVVLALVACSLRSIGVAVLAPVVFAWCWRDTDRRSVVIGAVAAAAGVLPVAWFTGHLHTALASEVPLRILSNAVRYATAFIPYAVLPDPGQTDLTLAAGLFVVLVAAWGLWRWTEGVVVGTVVLYLAGVLVWPVHLSGERYIVPLLPIVCIGLAVAMLRAEACFRGSVDPKRWVAGIVVPAAFVLVGYQHVWHLSRVFQGGFFRTPGASAYAYAAVWIRDNTPKDAVIVCRKPSAMEVLSNRRAEGFPFEGPDVVMAWIQEKGATHVVIDDLGYTQTGAYLFPAVDANRVRFLVDEAQEFGRPSNTVLVQVRKEQ